MVVSEGKFWRQNCFARVHIIVNEIDSASTVSLELDATGYLISSYYRGNIQKAHEANDPWIQGAVIGANYALAQLKNSVYAVTITDIVGTDVDTTPTAVAVATIFAVWKAVNYQPSDDETQLFEDKILANLGLPYDTLPTF
jgi:hypothetical protein